MGIQPPPKKGADTLNFRPMSIVAKRLDNQDAHLIRMVSCVSI